MPDGDRGGIKYEIRQHGSLRCSSILNVSLILSELDLWKVVLITTKDCPVYLPPNQLAVFIFSVSPSPCKGDFLNKRG